MNDDDLCHRLRTHKVRRPPLEWRKRILEVTARAAPAKRCSASYQEWFWPCPQAWAGLAAAWIIIGILQLMAATAAPRETVLGEQAQIEIGRATVFLQQRRELTEILDIRGTEPDSRTNVKPGPRGGLRETFRRA